ncbi:hypothetical protein T12_4776, partial [Trichinella patagoniensis]
LRVVDKTEVKCVESMTSSMFRLNDVIIDNSDVHLRLSVSAWPRMPLMSSSGHPTMFA